MLITRFPALFIAAAVGEAIAVPTPPPIATTVPKRAISEGLPSGPRIFGMLSPVSRQLRRWVVLPMDCTAMVTVPRKRLIRGAMN
jgi:hypothetical protein